MTRTASNAAYKWATPTPGTTANAYDGLNRDSAIVTAGGYDLRGNLTADGSRTFTYDVENRMLTAVSGGTTVMFAYDPIGRLTTTATPASTTFLYDSDRLSAEYSAVGAVLRRYVHGPGVDEPLVWYEGAGTTDRRWLHQDRQGSVIGWSNGSGTVSASTIYKYGPWGEPGDAWGAGSRFRYTGQIAIPEARLYHYKARMYDPATGRFMQTDPIGYRDDLDLYAYVGGDPVNKSDPTGLAGDDWRKGGKPPPSGDNSEKFKLRPPNPARALLARVFLPAYAFYKVAIQPTQANAGEDKKLDSQLSGLGDLTKGEVRQIQGVVNDAGRPLDVVGSAARGERRGSDTDLPVGKGPGTRSDIDYVTGGANLSYFRGLEGRLPSADPNQPIGPGTPSTSEGPSIRFEPSAPPRHIPGG